MILSCEWFLIQITRKRKFPSMSKQMPLQTSPKCVRFLTHISWQETLRITYSKVLIQAKFIPDYFFYTHHMLNGTPHCERKDADSSDRDSWNFSYVHHKNKVCNSVNVLMMIQVTPLCEYFLMHVTKKNGTPQYTDDAAWIFTYKRHTLHKNKSLTGMLE